MRFWTTRTPRVLPARSSGTPRKAVDLFARLRLVGEGRVALGVGEGEGLRGRGDEADEAFARAHDGQVDGFPVQALGGEQLEHAIAAHHIDGAHLRHHVGGDLGDDLVETVLRPDRLRHDLAEAQQKARTAGSTWHELISSRPSRAGEANRRHYISVAARRASSIRPDQGRYSERCAPQVPYRPIRSDGEFNLRRRDRPDVDALASQGLEARAATPAWLRMPTPIAETSRHRSHPGAP